MLILSKTSIKTTTLLVLFILFSSFSFATKALDNLPDKHLFSAEFYLPLNDTTKTEITPETKVPEKPAVFSIPEILLHKTIEFQVNSDINYLSFRHFIKPEAKKAFFNAWIKELELKKLLTQTDSLRKVYSHASDNQKEQIASTILKNEQQTIQLNEEIPTLYQNAREIEDKYWQTAATEELNSFRKKLSQFKDSLDQAARKIQEQNEKNAENSIDTLLLLPDKVNTTEAKAETNPEIIYKIQIGAFKGKIPEPANKLIKKLSVIRKVENYVDDKGVKVFTTGNLRTYQEAVTLQSQVKQEGVKSPVVAAYHKGKRITVAEAKKINKEL